MFPAKTPHPLNNVSPETSLRWSKERAHQWHKKQGWLVGCNFVPHTAINQIEMWQAESFDPFSIDRELSWAAGLGFNTVRVFLHHLVWEADPSAYLHRIDLFLAMADKYNIKIMLVLFDAVWDPFPKLGKQPDPKPFVHNSGWVQCPGFDVLNNPDRYEDLKHYVEGIVNHFKNDERVLVWDLFNEPDNLNTGSYKDDNYIQHKAELSLQLLQKTIGWVRAINPIQPITMAPWQGMDKWHSNEQMSAIDNYMFSQSDVISFHCYEDVKGMQRRIKDLQRFDRPMLCTEYMARTLGSTFQEILPLFQKHNIGGYNWGFVAGRSQTHCPWDSWHKTYEQEPETWFHDIFRSNGEPYVQAEVDFIRNIIAATKKKKRSRQAA